MDLLRSEVKSFEQIERVKHLNLNQPTSKVNESRFTLFILFYLLDFCLFIYFIIA